MKFLHKLWLLAVVGVLWCGTAQAHPHMWIEAQAALLFNDDGALSGVRHTWRFDEGSSAYITLGLDEDGDGTFSREELTELAEVNMTSLKDFEYFTYLMVGKDEPPYASPKDYYLEYGDGRLILRFTVPFEVPVSDRFSDLILEIFDPSFYTDITFLKDEHLTLVDAPSGCSARLQRPVQLDAALEQQLAEIPVDGEVPVELLPQSKGALANTVRLVCS